MAVFSIVINSRLGQAHTDYISTECNRMAYQLACTEKDRQETMIGCQPEDNSRQVA
jgi:hypothetical protein